MTTKSEVLRVHFLRDLARIREASKWFDRFEREDGFPVWDFHRSLDHLERVGLAALDKQAEEEALTPTPGPVK